MDTLLVEGYLESEYHYVDASNNQPFQNFDPNQGNISVIQVPDFPDDCLNYISEILMEEGLDDKHGRFHDYSAVLATEQSLYDALREDSIDDPFDDQFALFPSQIARNPDNSSNGYSLANSSPLDSNSLTSPLEYSAHSSSSSSSIDLPPIPALRGDIPLVSALDSDDEFDWFTLAIKHVPENSTSNYETVEDQIIIEAGEVVKRENPVDGSKGMKTHQRDETDIQDNARSRKLLAAYNDDYVQMEQYDDVLLCKDDCTKVSQKPKMRGSDSKASKVRRARGKKETYKEEVVDLRTLLTLCAQAVASFDMRNANHMLRKIRQHSSQFGDSTERVAHYFAYGLEARIVGCGSHLSVDPVVDSRLSSSDILKSYRTYVEAIPLRRTSYYLANRTIGKSVENATAIHIIDFGIFYGFQWPSFIQCLSKRANGPPKLRITGIGFPQRGFRPSAIVEETGKRLAGYCKRFNVPFEYHHIAKKWEAISPEDIIVDREELVVVNCLYESRTLIDETVEEFSPRDAFLRLVRSLNPNIFVHGIINGTFNSPFFMTRFREALFHYSTIFDMMEATMPKEDPERLLLERELYGKAALNVISCEGVERLERPETYKQWQVRTLRAGFKQIPLNREMVSMVKEKVKANYHKDFVLGEDGQWMLQGWKGRILYAISCWRSASVHY